MDKYYSKYIGIPYKHLGRDYHGVDCYGLLILYFKEQFNYDFIDWWYEPDWSKKGENYFIEKRDQYTQKVSNPRVHDIVMIYTDVQSRVVNHTGIVVEPDKYFIQAVKHGVVLTNLQSPVFSRRIEGYYRICQK